MIDELKPYEKYILDICFNPQLNGSWLLTTKHTCGHIVTTCIDEAQSEGAFDERLLPAIQEICQDVCPICRTKVK